MPSQFTVVVFSRNRPRQLARAIDYYRKLACPTIVADGSVRPLALDHAAENLTYLHMPQAAIYDRIAFALSMVDTPAVVLATDDDRMLGDTLARCASAIVQDPSLVRVCGTALSINANDRDFRFAAPDLPVERVLDLSNPPTAWDRYLELVSKSPGVFYAVIRTEVAQAVSRIVKSIPDGAALIAEQLWIVLPGLAGKTSLCDQLQFIRTRPVVKGSYSAYVQELMNVRRIDDWNVYQDVLDALRDQAGFLGVDRSIVCRVGSHFAHSNWFTRSKSTVTGGLAARVQRIVRFVRLACRHPLAVTSYSKRACVRGVESRALARCASYPWNPNFTGPLTVRDLHL